MQSRFILTLAASAALVLSLSQCSQMRSDCAALSLRRAEIAQEQPGDYYIGRRYYIPSTRFWGYLRRPGQGWETAQLVIMDETVVRTPDRGYEPPIKGATFGKDNNYEYIVRGSFRDKKCYEPNSDQILPFFKATSFDLKSKKPGFLFVPSEKYKERELSLRPMLVPSPQHCAHQQ